MRCNTSKFSYHGKTKAFVAEASDFGPLREGHLLDRLTQLYPDAADRGIFLTSKRTGATIRYYLARTEKDVEGDVRCWMFRPVQEAHTIPAAMGTKIIIYND